MAAIDATRGQDFQAAQAPAGYRGPGHAISDGTILGMKDTVSCPDGCRTGDQAGSFAKHAIAGQQRQPPPPIRLLAADRRSAAVGDRPSRSGNLPLPVATAAA